ncbi:glycosyltransferase [Alphaproteobacteria bacterium]|nr:glycosyltransferase [Alphaproteobacteria bacterium]
MKLNLSIIICTKNSAQTIISCLNSSLVLLKAGAELIVVDSCSNDKTIKYLLEFLKKNNILYYKIITQLNNGLYKAFNQGIENTSRNKILFLHSDDTLKNIHSLILDTKKSNADVIFYGVEIEGTLFRRKWHLKNLISININSMLLPPHTGILVSRDVYSKIGKFNTDYEIAGDFDWMLRLLSSSNISFSFSSEITYVMKSGGVSNSGIISEIKKFLEDVKVLKSLGFKFAIYKVLRKKISKLHQLKRI